MKSEGTASQTNPRLIFTALLILGVTGGVYFRGVWERDRAEEALFSREIATLEETFQAEKLRLESETPGGVVVPEKPLPSGVKVTRVPIDGSRLSVLLTEKESAAKGIPSRMRFRSQSWEGFPTTIQFLRLPEKNAFLMVEKVHSPLKITEAAGGARSALLKNLALLLCALIGAGVFVLGLFSSREVKPAKQEKESRETEPPSGQWIEQMSEKIHAATSELAREASVEQSLVMASHRATHLPSLYFRYHPKEGILKLSAEAGLKTSSRLHHGGMSFALPNAVLNEIFAAESRKERRDLSDQPALIQILRSQYGISHFEAWPTLEAPSLRARKLLGALIVARATSAYLYSKREDSRTHGFRFEEK